MKTKAKSVEECTTLFEIEVTKETLSKAFEQVYDEIAKVAKIPGFRVGMVPLALVKRHYAKDAKDEVLKRLIPEAYRRALEEHGINPVGLPEISDLTLEEEKALSFKAKVETRPKFKLKSYKGIRLDRKKILIKDEDVDKTLQNLRELNAKYISEPSRPVQLGDYVVSDLECFVEGKPIYKKRENLWLSIDKDSFIPGLGEKMVGMKQGEDKDFEIVLPDKYPDKSLVGKLATYRVKVKEIKSKALPSLDDEFAKDLGKESLIDLRKAVQEELTRRMRLNADMDVENQLLNKLMDENNFQVPSGMVKRQLNLMVEDAKVRLEKKGFKRDELDKKDDEFVERFKGDANRQVKLLFILDEIARIENIEVEDVDVEEAYKAIAAQTGSPLEKVKDYYKKEGLVDSLREKVKEEKVVKLLLDNAEVISEKL